jgi:hypothetical protein
MARLARIQARPGHEPLCDQYRGERHPEHNAARGRENHEAALHQDDARVFAKSNGGPPEVVQIASKEEDDVMKSQLLVVVWDRTAYHARFFGILFGIPRNPEKARKPH